MGFSAAYLVVNVRYTLLGQQCQTGLAHAIEGIVFTTATAAEVAEAYWNDVKDQWRAIAPDSLDIVRFTSVQVREVGGDLSLGEYAIPSGEQAGTRDAGTTDTMMPSYVAVGCRLTVGSSITRPGQKRIPFLVEGDVASNSVDPAFLTLCEDLCEAWSTPRNLGAPVALGVLEPAVLTFGVDQNTVAAAQLVVGYVLNPFITSQVSRRYGHGN